MSCKRRLVKVEMEYDNGDIQHLAGKDAEEWLQTINSHLTFTFVHGMDFPEFQWKQADRKGQEAPRQ